MPAKKRNTVSALSRKGFIKEETSHHPYYIFTNSNGEVYDKIKTHISHGSNKDIDNKLLTKMAKQMGLESRSELEKFIDCTLTEDSYRKMLREKGENV